MRSDGVERPRPDVMRQAEAYVSENPIAAVLGAVALGFALGMIARSLEKEPEPEPIRDALRELRTMISPFAKRTRQAYADSSDAVRNVVESAVEKARDFETRPVRRWWQRRWA